MSAVSKKVTGVQCGEHDVRRLAWSRREPKLLHPTPTTDTCSDPGRAFPYVLLLESIRVYAFDTSFNR